MSQADLIHGFGALQEGRFAEAHYHPGHASIGLQDDSRALKEVLTMLSTCGIVAST